MTFCQILSPAQKALAINLDDKIYGSLAEIGAGQEVARHFFRAGGAAGTIAKTISAYDMVVSDTIYGKEKSGRYVCEDRAVTMMNREFEQLIERLQDVRDEKTKYFGFANTVAAKSFKGNRESHGWMGLTFQHEAQSGPSSVVIHVRMLDRENLQQQEALGHIGVNLIYSSYFKNTSGPSEFISSLMEGLTTDRIEIDMIRTSGPAFDEVDHRLFSLELIKRRYCQAVMFNSKGEVLQASDALYKKNVLVARGSFRPPTNVNLDMLKTGLDKFKSKLDKSEHNSILVLPEISMNKLIERGKVENLDFLARVDLLTALGQNVLISNYKNFHDLSPYLQNYSKKKVSFVMGIYNLIDIFNRERYEDCQGGILSGLGTLFGHDVSAYIYPGKDDDGNLISRDTFEKDLNPKLKPLFNYLEENGFIEDIKDHDPKCLSIWSREVLGMIEANKEGWEVMVPELVSQIVKKKKLFSSK